MLQTVEQIDKDRIKEGTEYLQTGLTMPSRDFEIAQHIEDEEKMT